ncbi:GTP 3',8-cyclase MoaA [Flavobacteriales bacterium]|nr:GTP 3',8-cyclase MoaA [Flavobacteriales bacterium]
MTTATANIVDRFGRVHDYLRISLTERCNLRCFYCMPENGIQLRDKAEFMTSEELLTIAKAFVEMGIKKIRLTGGEPLIKKNAHHIIEELGKLPVELSITTNAVIVDQFIDSFKRAGIRSVNVSLDSLDKDTIDLVTRRNYGQRIMDNIDLLIQNGFTVKINAVIIKGVNDREIISFIEWTKFKDVSIRFIEFMPFDGNKWNMQKMISHKQIMQLAYTHFSQKKVVSLSPKQNDTSKNYQVKGYLGTFGIISPVTNPFCDTCNRIRLTADGKIKNCLFSASESDLLFQLRQGKEIKTTIEKSMLSKSSIRHRFIYR